MIESNIKDFIKGLDDLDKKQLPYAFQVALNKTAELAMQSTKKQIDETFNISQSWNTVGGKFGIKKKSATKSNLEVEIFIPNENKWIQDHEEGGVRTGIQLIPTKGFYALFPKLKNKSKKIKEKANQLLSDKAKYRIFDAPITTGYGEKRKEGSSNGTMAIYQRVKGNSMMPRQKAYRKKTKGGKIIKSTAGKVILRNAIPLFIIKDSVKQKPILKFKDSIMDSFNKNFDLEFEKAFDYAINTAK
jgi:hypothetical protein